MRATSKLEHDLLVRRKPLAAAQGNSLRLVVPELARKGRKRCQNKLMTQNGLVLFNVSPGVGSCSLEVRRRAKEKEDKRHARPRSARQRSAGAGLAHAPLS